MDADAVVMMVVAMLVLWGGLVLAIANLLKGDARAADGDVER